VHVDPVITKLKPTGIQRLKLKCDVLLSTSAFKYKLRRFIKAAGTAVAAAVTAAAAGTAQAAGAAAGCGGGAAPDAAPDAVAIASEPAATAAGGGGGAAAVDPPGDGDTEKGGAAAPDSAGWARDDDGDDPIGSPSNRLLLRTTAAAALASMARNQRGQGAPNIVRHVIDTYVEPSFLEHQGSLVDWRPMTWQAMSVNPNPKTQNPKPQYV